ncbi:MAG: TRAP transporter large permease subunit [Cyanobacteria bacterium J06641_2]
MIDWLGPLMFAAALALLSLGYPVAFSLGGVSIIFALIGTALGVTDLNLFGLMPSRIFDIMKNYTLLAIPYFIFMGSMLEKTGIAERLLETMGILLGRIRGGLALAVVIVGALLAATTGVVAATVIAMGLISLPIMLRYGYDKKLATGVIAASGTLGQIIPPSVVLIVLADQLGISVGDLFIGSIIPGLMMAGAFALYVLIIAFLKPEIAPPLPPEVRNIGVQALILKIIQVMLPPLALILLVLGSIFFGFATPTEAGAVGCVATIILAAIYRKLTLTTLSQVCNATMRITSMVMFILIGSTAFALIFKEGLNGGIFMENVLSNIPGGQVGFMIVSMIVVLLLGFFIDFFEIAFIVIPLFVPVAQQFGIDLVWYGVVLGANLQTSFLTPPFGFALFYLRSVTPK